MEKERAESFVFNIRPRIVVANIPEKSWRRMQSLFIHPTVYIRVHVRHSESGIEIFRTQCPKLSCLLGHNLESQNPWLTMMMFINLFLLTFRAACWPLSSIFFRKAIRSPFWRVAFGHNFFPSLQLHRKKCFVTRVSKRFSFR